MENAASQPDSQNSEKLWSDNYEKTISIVENRIITRGPSPQTEQLGKIKDYSRYICPRIANSVQNALLPKDILAKESTIIGYDMGDIDNVFTKKYRRYAKETNQMFIKRKKAKKAKNQQTELEVKATQIKPNENIYRSSNKEDQTLFDSIDIKKTRKNNLLGEYDSDKPNLRDYAY